MRKLYHLVLPGVYYLSEKQTLLFSRFCKLVFAVIKWVCYTDLIVMTYTRNCRSILAFDSFLMRIEQCHVLASGEW